MLSTFVWFNLINTVLCNLIPNSNSEEITRPPAPTVVSFQTYKDWSSRLTNDTSTPKTASTLLLLHDSEDVEETSASTTQKTVVDINGERDHMFSSESTPKKERINAHNFAAQVLSKFAYISPLLALPSSLSKSDYIKSPIISKTPIMEMTEKTDETSIINNAENSMTLEALNEIDSDPNINQIKSDRKSASAISFPTLTSTTGFDINLPSTTLGPMLSDVSTTDTPLESTFSEFPRAVTETVSQLSAPQNTATDTNNNPYNTATDAHTNPYDNSNSNAGTTNPNDSHDNAQQDSDPNIHDASHDSYHESPDDSHHTHDDHDSHDMHHDSPHYHSHDSHHHDDDDHHPDGSSEEPEDYEDDEELESFRYPVRVTFHDADDDPISVQDTSTPQFMIPNIDLTADSLKQKGCKTIVKEVQAMPVDHMEQKQALRNRNVLKRNKRNSDKNGRKYTSIVMTKECHFPGDEGASSEQSPQTRMPEPKFHMPRLEPKYETYDPDFDFKPRLSYPSSRVPLSDSELRPKPSNTRRKYSRNPNPNPNSNPKRNSNANFGNFRKMPDYAEDNSDTFDSDSAFYDSQEFASPNVRLNQRQTNSRNNDRMNSHTRSKPTRNREQDTPRSRMLRSELFDDEPQSDIRDEPRTTSRSNQRSRNFGSDDDDDKFYRSRDSRSDIQHSPPSRSRNYKRDYEKPVRPKPKMSNNFRKRDRMYDMIDDDYSSPKQDKKETNSHLAKNTKRPPVLHSKEVSDRDTKNRKRGKKKPKKINKSFAFFKRNEPKEKDPNENDYSVSFGRGNFQSYSEDYDSDRDGPKPPKPVRIKHVSN